MKWGAESIAALSPYFHAMCWGVPAVLSVSVLVTNSVDGDVFTGICSVGNLNPSAVVYFFFTPIVVSLGEFTCLDKAVNGKSNCVLSLFMLVLLLKRKKRSFLQHSEQFFSSVAFGR